MSCLECRKAIISGQYGLDHVAHFDQCSACRSCFAASRAHLLLPNLPGAEILCQQAEGKIGDTAANYNSPDSLVPDVVAHIKSCSACQGKFNDLFVMIHRVVSQ